MIKTLKDYLSNGELKERKFRIGNLEQKDQYQIYRVLEADQKINPDLMQVLILKSSLKSLENLITDYFIPNHLNDIEIN